MTLGDLLQATISMILAVFGGTIRLLRTPSRKKPKLTYFLRGMAIASFSGFVAHFLCQENEVSANLAIVFTALAGFAGPAFIDGVVKKYLPEDSDKK